MARQKTSQKKPVQVSEEDFIDRDLHTDFRRSAISVTADPSRGNLPVTRKAGNKRPIGNRHRPRGRRRAA